jgi:hypothetical protein
MATLRCDQCGKDQPSPYYLAAPGLCKDCWRSASPEVRHAHVVRSGSSVDVQLRSVFQKPLRWSLIALSVGLLSWLATFSGNGLAFLVSICGFLASSVTAFLTLMPRRYPQTSAPPDPLRRWLAWSGITGLFGLCLLFLTFIWIMIAFSQS